MRALHACLLLATGTPLLGCSVMGLDDFGVTPCLSNDDCEDAEAVLNPGKAKCGVAVCELESGLCKWQDAKETCNGVDDDCDGLIDEDLTISAQESSSLTEETAVVGYSAATDAGQTFVAVASSDHSSQLFAFPPLAGDSSHEIRYESEPSRFNFSEVALAADAAHLVVASINTFGCAFGQVHVGLSDLDRPFEVRQAKPTDAQSGDASNIEIGIDLDVDHCTGASRSATVNGAPSRGATQPAVASLGTEPNGKGALLVWLGSSTPEARESGASPRDPIRVEALGLKVPALEPVWLNGTNQRPSLLGHSTSRSAPAVLALKASQRYLVAFPTELGLQLLSVQPDPSLRAPDSLGIFPDAAIDQVSLALGNADEVGVAWRTGAGADAQVCFAVVSTAGEQPRAGTSASLSQAVPHCQPGSHATDVRSFAPQLLYRQLGFANKPPKGGWFLSWDDPMNEGSQMFHVVRLHEESTTILSESLRNVDGVSLVYPRDDAGSVAFATVRSAAQGKSQPQTMSRLWCE